MRNSPKNSFKASTAPAPPEKSPGRGGVRIAIVGAGPVGVGLAERLLANAGALLGELTCEIVLIDPYPPGAGRVWRTDQSPLMRMNSMARDVTLFPGPAVRCEGPARPGPALHEWAEGVAAGRLPPLSDPRLLPDLHEVTPESFPTRRLQGEYLSWFLDHLIAEAPPGVRVLRHAGRAADLTEGPDGRQTVHLADGGAIEADAVALALGHLDVRPSGETAELAAFAAEHGLVYLPPGYAADLDLSVVPAGADVLVRGLGLAFFDFMALLTEGRGGRYVRDATGGLRYLPGGREPRLFVGSRRGVPYRCKPGHRLALPPPDRPRYLTDEVVAGLLAAGRPVRFRDELWPLVVKDLCHAYHRELFAVRPDAVTMSWERFEARLDEVTEPGEAAALSAEAVVDEADRLDVTRLGEPLRGVRLPSGDVLQKHLRGLLEDELARDRNPRRSPDTALYAGLLALYGRLARIRPRLDARSQVEELDGAWFSLFNFVSSGPPAFRVEELLALSRAGIVEFLGAGMTVTGDARRGLFRASGVTAPGEVTAPVLIDARLPEITVARDAGPLLPALHAAGAVTEEVLSDPATGYRHTTGRIAVDARGHLVDAAGRAHPSRYALGWNTSLRGARAFALPDTDAITFRHADLVARELLRGLAARAARPR